MTKLFHYLTVVCLFTFFSCTASAQYYYYNNNYYEKDITWEMGFSMGAMNCITDVGGAKGKGGFYINDINWAQSNLSGGVYVGLLYKQTFGIRLESIRGSVSGADNTLKGSSIAASRYTRNLYFRSSISEFSLMAEFHPLPLTNLVLGDGSLSPYITGGIGRFSFNPQASVNGRIVDLQPLRTEGQGFEEYKDRQPYKLTQTNIPIGVGIRYDISPIFHARVEAIHRFLHTDYLDDVSSTWIDPEVYNKYFSERKLQDIKQIYNLPLTGPAGATGARGNPKTNDSYMTLSLKFGLTLGRERR
jgi:hypothetical protein